MSIFTKLANSIFSPVSADGTARQISPQDAQRWGTELERILTGLAAGELDIEFPYGFIPATNSGGGSANAIRATTALPIPTGDASALIALPIVTTNTGPATVRFGNGPVLPIRTSSGNEVEAEGLRAGMVVAGYISDGAFRLLSDQASEALVSAAENAADDAKAARDTAIGAASSFLPNIFATEEIAEAYKPDFVPVFLRTAGKRSPDDGGGGLYTNPVVAEPAIGPKLFNAHVNRWFTGSETVMDIMRFGARRLGAGTSGAIADNDAALADAKEWLFGRLIGGAYPELQFGPGVYDYSEFPNFARNRVSVIGQGEVKLRFHGSGTALLLDGLEESLSGDGAWEMKFKGFQVETPASAAGDAIQIRACHESDFDIECRGASPNYAGLRLHWLVSSRIRYRCAGNGFGWYDNAIPNYALRAEDNPDWPGYTATSFCHIHADTTGTPYGAALIVSNGIMLRGTFQAHGIIGVHMGPDCQDTVLFNSDMEANLDTGLLIQGENNTVRDSVCLDPTAISGSSSRYAKNNRIQGGIFADITLGQFSIGNTIDTVVDRYGAVGGMGVLDFGVNNSMGKSVVYGTGARVVRPKATLTIPPSGIVQWQNSFGDPMVISFEGGTILGFQIDNENVATPSPGGSQYVVPPGKVVAWEASVAPTVKVWGV